MSNIKGNAQALILHSTKIRRERDTGRRGAYNAEAVAFGGSWYEDSCTAPILTQQEAHEAFEMAVAWAVEHLLPQGRITLPKLIFNRKNSDHCRGDFRSTFFTPEVSMSLRKNSLRISSLLHEIAHWCVQGGRPHGTAWQAAYVALVHEFMGESYAKALREAFSGGPTGAKRRATYLWEVLGEGEWHPIKKKDIQLDSQNDYWAKQGSEVLGYRREGEHSWRSCFIRARKR